MVYTMLIFQSPSVSQGGCGWARTFWVSFTHWCLLQASVYSTVVVNPWLRMRSSSNPRKCDLTTLFQVSHRITHKLLSPRPSLERAKAAQGTWRLTTNLLWFNLGLAQLDLWCQISNLSMIVSRECLWLNEDDWAVLPDNKYKYHQRYLKTWHGN